MVKELLEKEAEKEAALRKIRYTNIQHHNQLAKLEHKIREKEELAEGLHLIDFEQLKIENQSLNEKIEERNEELMKLRKKTTTTVQILTHLKEKQQFILKENQQKEAMLLNLEASMAEKREILQNVKGARDRLRTKSLNLKEKSTFITSPQLLQDLEVLDMLPIFRPMMHAQNDVLTGYPCFLCHVTARLCICALLIRPKKKGRKL